MTDYVKSTNFTSKDSLPSGNALKIIKGTEFDVEFSNIATAIATKVDTGGSFGTPTSLVLTNATNLPLTTGVTGILPFANGGTNATSASAARTSLGLAIGTDVPSPTGTGASGTWGISISGNAATATTAANGGVTSVNGSTGAVTVSGPTTTDVLAATASATAGAVGTYAFLYASTTSSYAFGSTLAGSSLYASGISQAFDVGGFSYTVTTTPAGTQSGTWRCMGNVLYQNNVNASTLWLRIS